MKNEPVAWMHHCLKSGIGYLSYTKPPPLDDYKPIPLYTHPVKELTDEEINDIYDEWQALSGDPVKLYELFKLKAQEK